MNKMSLEEFCNKIAWEGGIADALDYGLSSDDLSDSYIEAKKVWREMEDVYSELSLLIRSFQEIASDYFE